MTDDWWQSWVFSRVVSSAVCLFNSSKQEWDMELTSKLFSSWWTMELPGAGNKVSARYICFPLFIQGWCCTFGILTSSYVALLHVWAIMVCSPEAGGLFLWLLANPDPKNIWFQCQICHISAWPKHTLLFFPSWKHAQVHTVKHQKWVFTDRLTCCYDMCLFSSAKAFCGSKSSSSVTAAVSPVTPGAPPLNMKVRS